MTMVKTDLGKMRESAKTERFMPSASIRATNVQDAIEAVAGQPKVVVPTHVTVTPYNATASDSYLLVDVAGPVTINLPTIASRGGLPLTIKDGSSAAATNNITIIPNGAETIDTLAQIVITQDSGAFNIVPPPGETDWNII